MRKGTVLSFKKLRLFDIVYKNNFLIVMLILFVAGIVFGVFSVKDNSALTNSVSNYLKDFSKVRSDGSFLGILTDSFLSNLLVLAVVFAFGSSVVGVVVVPLFVAYKGVFYGAVSAFLYSEHSIKGVAFNAVLLVPFSLIFIIAFLLAARESLQFSLIISKMTLPNSSQINLNRDFKTYCVRFIFIAGIVMASAVVDALISNGLIDAFQIKF